MVFSWIRRWRRGRIAESSFPAAWLEYLDRNVAHYPLLPPAEQAKLRRDTQIFVAEKNWEGCGGLTVTDEMRVTIAAQACLLLLGLNTGVFDRVLSILIYPREYVVPAARRLGGGETVSSDVRLGEAWYRGPVVLSWAEVSDDCRHFGDGRNVVWHEFAHQLDMLDGASDGTPPLASREQYRRWTEVMTAELENLRAARRRWEPTLIDPYGTTNEAEFFAVVTECFFNQPVEMRLQHRQLYDLLAEFYRQDTAARLSASR
ncbi:MAG TPA: M90 family metallopeptidase [Pirellulales bacterium]|nr:M90 family metallopeptidase [Pirellulales bacterium]